MGVQGATPPGLTSLKPHQALLLLILATALTRVGFGWALGLGVDESYMVASGRGLQLGYFDHPPASWWLAWGAARLFGSDAAVVVRLPFIALFALSTWLMFRLTEVLYSARAGFWAAVGINLAPVLGVTTGGWVLPDGPLVCALLAAVFCFVRALTGGTRWWLGAGLFAGLALFSKYSAVLTLGGAFLFLLTSREHRFWLGRWQPWAAVLVAFIVFSPVLSWNASHAWASFAFQGGRAEAARLHPLAPLATLGGEALFLLPWIWLALMAVFVRAVAAGPRDWRGWLLACLAAPPIVLFVVISLWSSQRVLYHWATPGYLMLFPLLGQAVAVRLNGRARAVIVGTAALIVAALLFVGSELRFAWVPAPLGPALLALDPQLDSLDWTALREDLAARGLLTPGTVIATPRWQDAGKIDYGLGGGVPVIVLSPDAREYGFARPASRFVGRDVVILAPGKTAAQVEPQFAARFTRIEKLPPLTLRRAGGPPLEIGVFLGTALRGT